MSDYCETCRLADCVCDGEQLMKERDEARARATSVEEEVEQLQQKNAQLLLRLANLDSTQIRQRNALREKVADMREAARNLWEDGRINGHSGHVTETHWVACPEDDTCECEYMEDVRTLMNHEPDKIIFLDIDGVLNSAPYFNVLSKTAYKKERGKAKAERRYSEMIDPEAVKLLNGLIEKTGAKVVVSSSWRVGRTAEEIELLLKERGFIGDIIDCTPVTIIHAPDIEPERGHEIQVWLDEHPDVRRYVIFDDYDDMAHLRPSLVQTSWSTGLLPQHIEAALPYLT